MCGWMQSIVPCNQPFKTEENLPQIDFWPKSLPPWSSRNTCTWSHNLTLWPCSYVADNPTDNDDNFYTAGDICRIVWKWWNLQDHLADYRGKWTAGSTTRRIYRRSYTFCLFHLQSARARTSLCWDHRTDKTHMAYPIHSASLGWEYHCKIQDCAKVLGKTVPRQTSGSQA